MIHLRIVICFCLLTVINNATAQTYKPMLQYFNEWHLTTCFQGCTTDIYYTDADTVVNGQTYHILDGYHYISRTFLLREDVTEKKVYLLKIGEEKNPSEILLYDFSMQVGDSILMSNPISPFPTNAGYFVLDSIIPRLHIDGDNYRHFYLTASDSVLAQSPNAVWIEGIGSLSLINAPGGKPDLNGAGELSCFFNNLTLHYSNLDSINSCIQVHTDLSTGNHTPYSIAVYPNPVSDILKIDFENNPDLKVSIINVAGQEIKAFSTLQLSSNEINISNLPKGLYFIKISVDGKVVLQQVLVKE